MALASSNRAQLAIIPEATFGVTPVTGNGKYLRMTGETLDFALTKENDKEISSDGNLSSSTTTDATASGDIKGHFQYAEYDALLASMMRTAWTVFGTNGVGATFTTTTITTTTITASVATSGSSIFTALQKGQWFRLNAPGNANDGKILRVSTSTAPTSTVIVLDVNTPAVAAGAVTGCTISASRAANGVTIGSFSIERQLLDVGQYFTYTGMYPSKFSTGFAAAGLTEVTFSFIGQDVVRNTSTQLPGSTVASQTYDIQNAVTGVGNIWENGVPLASTFIKSLKLDLDSGLRAQKAIGTLGAVGVGIGTFVAKGSIEVYFADGNLFDKFMNDVYTSLSWSSKDMAGNGYVFSAPRVMLTNAKIQAGAKDTDLMASFDFTCYADKANAIAALRQALFVDRFGAAVV